MHINTKVKKVKKLADGHSYSVERRYSTFMLPWNICVFTADGVCHQVEGRTFETAYNKLVKELENQA